MSNRSINLLQHSYANMVNDDSDFQPLNIAEDTMLSNDYEPGNFLFTNSNDKMKTKV